MVSALEAIYIVESTSLDYTMLLRNSLSCNFIFSYEARCVLVCQFDTVEHTRKSHLLSTCWVVVHY